MVKSIIFFCLALSTVFITNAQQFTFSKEIKFSQYLINNNQFDEAFFVLNKIDTTTLSNTQKDSLFFEIGWLSYSTKKLDSAILFLDKVSTADSRYYKAIFFTSYAQSYLRKFENGKITLKKIYTDTNLLKLKNFELASLALLEKNKSQFQQYASQFSFSDFYLKQEQQNLIANSNKVFNRKEKSPFVAGALSAILPGAGKWYAGKKRQAIGAFLPILSSAILTLEAYNRGGLKDARFWIYSTFFTTFYIGNIWGSTVAVKINNKEFNQVYENKVLFDMHIPLRNFFN